MIWARQISGFVVELDKSPAAKGRTPALGLQIDDALQNAQEGSHTRYQGDQYVRAYWQLGFWQVFGISRHNPTIS